MPNRRRQAPVTLFVVAVALAAGCGTGAAKRACETAPATCGGTLSGAYRLIEHCPFEVPCPNSTYEFSGGTQTLTFTSSSTLTWTSTGTRVTTINRDITCELGDCEVGCTLTTATNCACTWTDAEDRTQQIDYVVDGNVLDLTFDNGDVAIFTYCVGEDTLTLGSYPLYVPAHVQYRFERCPASGC